MTTPKKAKSQKHEQTLDSSTGETGATSNKSLIAEMTSREYLRLNRGEPDDKLIESYTRMNDTIPLKEIRDQQIRSIGETNAMDYHQAMDRSVKIHHEIVWQKRRELVIEMNHDTLQALARHYGISPSAECINDHPDANDLDKGLVLARLYQFFMWDVEYLGTALEMRDTNVEAAIEAAKLGTKSQQPSDTDSLESVLQRACNKANKKMLLQALKECIAVTCACPAVEKKLTLKIENTAAQIDDIGDTENYEKPDEIKASLKALKKRLRDHKEKLQEIHSYLDGFAPGKAMPKIVKDETDKWFDGQFTEGQPVGSKVRLAWVLDVFYSFWKKHQSAYLASDPSQREMQKKASAYGKQGALKRTDTKWRRYTSQFVAYTNNKKGRSNILSSDQAQTLADNFGEQLMAQKTSGATDNRTVAHIKEFISTLISLMDRNADDDDVQITWKKLSIGAVDQRKEKVSSDSYLDDTSTHTDKRLRGRKGKFRKSAFTSLTLETFKECFEILRASLEQRKVLPGTEDKPKKGRVKKN